MRPQQFLRTSLPTIAVVTGLALVGTTAPSTAAPPVRPGKVAGIEVGAISKPAAAYVVPATWTEATKATSYRVALVNSSSGATLDSETVTAAQWTASTTAAPGTSIRIRVTPYAGTRKGKVAQSTVKVLPDVTAPTGAFALTVDDDGLTATVNQTSLSDDVTPAGSIIRMIDWGESAEPSWTGWTGSSAAHTYPATEARYVPQVKLSDAAGNVRVFTLPGVVINDHVAPTGTFALTSTTAWANLTEVQLSQNELSDNWTPGNLVERRVDWGDGTPLTLWESGSLLTHVYRKAGPFTPTVTLTDEAQNTSVPVAAGTVTVAADTARPVVRLTLPRTGRTKVRKWVTLRGVAKDSGTGVRSVLVRAIEKRGTVWYSFRPTTGKWIKSGRSKSRALHRAGNRVVVPTAAGAWTARLPRLTKGKLVYRVRADDLVGNTSAVRKRTQLLTRR